MSTPTLSVPALRLTAARMRMHTTWCATVLWVSKSLHDRLPAVPGAMPLRSSIGPGTLRRKRTWCGEDARQRGGGCCAPFWLRHPTSMACELSLWAPHRVFRRHANQHWAALLIKKRRQAQHGAEAIANATAPCGRSKAARVCCGLMPPRVRGGATGRWYLPTQRIFATSRGGDATTTTARARAALCPATPSARRPTQVWQGA